MKLAWILWLSQMLPQPAADSLCLSTTVYLEARDQTLRGQQAVAEVALRRRDSGLFDMDAFAHDFVDAARTMRQA